MDKSIKCECGNNSFWWFGDYLRCPNCFMEFKQSGPKGRREFWQRRFNRDGKCYDKNWEHISRDEAQRSEGPSAANCYIPPVLFDGYTVFKEVDDYDENMCITTTQVSAVLDAVVRLIRRGI